MYKRQANVTQFFPLSFVRPVSLIIFGPSFCCSLTSRDSDPGSHAVGASSSPRHQYGTSTAPVRHAPCIALHCFIARRVEHFFLLSLVDSRRNFAKSYTHARIHDRVRASFGSPFLPPGALPRFASKAVSWLVDKATWQVLRLFAAVSTIRLFGFSLCGKACLGFVILLVRRMKRNGVFFWPPAAFRRAPSAGGLY